MVFHLRPVQHPDYRDQDPEVIIKSIPRSLQNAIGGGIGIFVAYLGLLNVGIISFDSGVPALATLNQPAFWLFLIGLALTIVLLVFKVKGAMLIGIIVTAILGIPMGVTVTPQHRQLYRGLPGAAHHLWRNLYRRRPAQPLYRYGEAAAGADHHLLLQRHRYLRHHRHLHRHRPPCRHLQRGG